MARHGIGGCAPDYRPDYQAVHQDPLLPWRVCSCNRLVLHRVCGKQWYGLGHVVHRQALAQPVAPGGHRGVERVSSPHHQAWHLSPALHRDGGVGAHGSHWQHDRLHLLRTHLHGSLSLLSFRVSAFRAGLCPCVDGQGGGYVPLPVLQLYMARVGASAGRPAWHVLRPSVQLCRFLRHRGHHLPLAFLPQGAGRAGRRQEEGE